MQVSRAFNRMDVGVNVFIARQRKEKAHDHCRGMTLAPAATGREVVHPILVW